MAEKTKKQIEQEIKGLKEIKPFIPETDFFGGNNHDKIDAQIKVLEENLSEDEIYDTWPDEEHQDIVSNARDAMGWRDGADYEGEGLVKDWASLDIRKKK